MGADDSLLVFVGPGTTSFEQVAASAHRRGIATAWIGYPLSWARRARLRCFIPHVSNAHNTTDLTRELRHLGPHRIADIQTAEYFLADVAHAARAAGLAPTIIADLERRHTLADKLIISQRLEQAGIPVPTALDATTTSPEQAITQLGLPLIVKGRVANAGTAVRTVWNIDAAAAAVAECSIYGGAMYERFIPGESLSYAAAYNQHGIVGHDAAYLTRRVGPSPTAPPDRVILVDDTNVLNIGRAVITQLGGHGLVNINVLRDPNGTPWVHDVNLRPWATLLALRSGGLDFVHGYLTVTGLTTPTAQPTTPPPPLTTNGLGQQLDVFPAAALSLAETDLLAGTLLFLSQIPGYLRWTGTDYVIAEATRATAKILRQRWRRLRPPGRPAHGLLPETGPASSLRA